MKKIFVVMTLALALPFYAYADNKAPWEGTFKPFKGEYEIYGGSLQEQKAPGRNDSKVAFSVEGSAAKGMFDAMQPDEKRKCTDAAGYRERRKGNVTCTYQPHSGYNCNFGFDLRTGKSISGASC
ncbi:hypothetical protein [Massilia aquatica]|uniref:DUF3617 family protein n=1 Tax=Massilia aquatica TaxID=2609000 RepID=A0ABX0LW80_9BURK|nr:hypothetical protein [Massilia aquatica]NHZ39020.1 hypothetical protein [Massilia aquatica]